MANEDNNMETEDILYQTYQQMKKLTTEVSSLRGAVTKFQDAPQPVVNIDSRSITNEAYGDLRQPLIKATSDFSAAASGNKLLAAELTQLKQQEIYIGFSTYKSALYYLALIVSLVILFGFSTVQCSNAKQAEEATQKQLDAANQHIRTMDEKIKVWEGKNLNDSKTFKEEVRNKEFIKNF